MHKILMGSSPSKATNNMDSKTKRRNKSLRWCQLGVCQPRTHPSGSTHLASAKWLVCFFAFRIYIVCGFEEAFSLENLHILSCLVWLKKHSVPPFNKQLKKKSLTSDQTKKSESHFLYRWWNNTLLGWGRGGESLLLSWGLCMTSLTFSFQRRSPCLCLRFSSGS